MTEVEQLKARVAELEDALRPFAHFHRVWNAAPMRGMGEVMYSINNRAGSAELTRTDCAIAAAVLDRTK